MCCHHLVLARVLNKPVLPDLAMTGESPLAGKGPAGRQGAASSLYGIHYLTCPACYACACRRGDPDWQGAAHRWREGKDAGCPPLR